MRKKVYEVLKALQHGDIISVYTCKLDGISSQVKNEISELRNVYGVRIVTVGSFVGRHSAYFLDSSNENIKRVEMLLNTYKKKENHKVHK